MKHIEKLGIFGKLIMDEHVYLDPSLNFREVCRMIGADPGEMDGYLREEVGLSGDELFLDLRKSYRKYLENKYARDIVIA